MKNLIKDYFMSDTFETQKTFLQTYGPVLLAFTLATVSTSFVSYKLLDDEVAKNALKIENMRVLNTVMSDHLVEFGAYKIQIASMNDAVRRAASDQKGLRQVIGKLDDTLMNMNTTLVTISTSYGKDIEHIESRLTKAGL